VATGKACVRARFCGGGTTWEWAGPWNTSVQAAGCEGSLDNSAMGNRSGLVDKLEATKWATSTAGLWSAFNFNKHCRSMYKDATTAIP
ncbi:MAG: hypothetical protein Q7U84_04095, partial [Polynucleobacter sp.]|nr:hypothetical protein [Polynucleobacter sp.]